MSLTEAERCALERFVRGLQTPQQRAMRARIILGAATGRTNAALAQQLQVEVDTVRLWRQRWAATVTGTPAQRLADAPRAGAPARITPAQVCQIIAVAGERPRDAARPISHWSSRELADEIQARGIVATISPRHAARVLKKGSSSHIGFATG